MHLMTQVFRPFLGKFVGFYFDEILIYSNCKGEHIRHVSEVPNATYHHKLLTQLKKCAFTVPLVNFLGYIV